MSRDALNLAAALAAWKSDDFRVVLCREIEALGPHRLPLQQALAQSSRVSDSPIRVMALRESATGTEITARVGVLYGGVVAGCNCADDPTPIDEQNETCTLEFTIDRRSGDARVRVVADPD